MKFYGETMKIKYSFFQALIFFVLLLMCTQYHLLFSLPPEKYFYSEILSRKYLHLHLNFSIQKSLMTENRKWNNDRLILSVPIVTKIKLLQTISIHCQEISYEN